MKTEPHMRARCFVKSFGLIYLWLEILRSVAREWHHL